MWCDMCIRIKSKRKTMNLFFSFEKYLYLYLKYFQKYLYLYLNTFTNECICICICIWPNEKYLYLYLNTFQCIWPHRCLVLCAAQASFIVQPNSSKGTCYFIKQTSGADDANVSSRFCSKLSESEKNITVNQHTEWGTFAMVI